MIMRNVIRSYQEFKRNSFHSGKDVTQTCTPHLCVYMGLYIFFGLWIAYQSWHFFVGALELMSRASIKERAITRPAPSIKRSLIDITSFFPTRNIKPNLSSYYSFSFRCVSGEKEDYERKKMRLNVRDVSLPCADKSASKLNR